MPLIINKTRLKNKIHLFALYIGNIVSLKCMKYTLMITIIFNIAHETEVVAAHVNKRQKDL